MPETPSPVTIPSSLLQAVYREARKSYPNEACGWLTGSADGNRADAIRACVNAKSLGVHSAVPDRVEPKPPTNSPPRMPSTLTAALTPTPLPWSSTTLIPTDRLTSLERTAGLPSQCGAMGPLTPFSSLWWA